MGGRSGKTAAGWCAEEFDFATKPQIAITQLREQGKAVGRTQWCWLTRVMETTRRFVTALVNLDCNTRGHPVEHPRVATGLAPLPAKNLNRQGWPTTKPATPIPGHNPVAVKDCTSARTILLSHGFVARRHA